MNGPELLRIVDAMHRDKNIPKEIIFEGIESALQLAAERAHHQHVQSRQVPPGHRSRRPRRLKVRPQRSWYSQT